MQEKVIEWKKMRLFLSVSFHRFPQKLRFRRVRRKGAEAESLQPEKTGKADLLAFPVLRTLSVGCGSDQ